MITLDRSSNVIDENALEVTEEAISDMLSVIKPNNELSAAYTTSLFSRSAQIVSPDGEASSIHQNGLELNYGFSWLQAPFGSIYNAFRRLIVFIRDAAHSLFNNINDLFN